MNARDEALKTVMSELLTVPADIHRRIIGGAGELDDAVSVLRIPNSVDTASKSGTYGFILDLLGHISVNPSKAFNTYFLNHAFVYKPNQPDDSVSITANRSQATADRFMNDLIHAAKHERDRNPGVAPASEEEEFDNEAKAEKRNRQRFFALTGGRGMGKTIFLNHLLSAKAEMLNNENVVWIRLNLTLDRGFDTALEEWIMAQTAKILLRYYDNQSEFTAKCTHRRYDFYDHLGSWIDNLREPPTLKSQLLEARLAMKQVFMMRGSDQDISRPLCQKNICLELFRYARQIGLSFIVVFDGYDRLDHDRANRRRFQDLTHELQRLAVSNAATGAVFLVVSRNNTFAWLRSVQPFRRMFENRHYVIDPVSIIDIVSLRLNTISSWARSRGEATQSAQGLLEIERVSADFLSFFLQHYNAGELKELDNTLHTNSRAKIQIVQLLFQDFVQKHERQGYRLLEFMVKAGFAYPPLVYSYCLTENGVEGIIQEEVLYDSRFLPIITRPPVPWVGGQQSEYDASYYKPASLLHGVRALQLLDCVNRKLSIDNMQEVLHRWFDYDGKITAALLYELESYELLGIERSHQTYDESPHDLVWALPKTKFFLAHVFGSVAYLNLCGMRTLLSRKSLSAGLVKAATLRTPRGADRPAALRNWVNVKVLNSIVMASAAHGVNEEQKRVFPSKIKSRSVTGIERILIEENIPERMFLGLADLRDRVARDLVAMIGTGGDLVDAKEVASAVAKLRDIHSEP